MNSIGLAAEVLEEIRKNEFLLPVACSGGSDSVALVRLLSEISDLRDRLVVLHFDHLTRNGASSEDAKFVEHLAQELHLPFYLGKFEGNMQATRNENVFRNARLMYFHNTLKALKTPYLITAHHLNDSIELLLLRLARGASLEGLVALQPIQPYGENFIHLRPLIHLKKQELTDYLLLHHHAWREDQSNQENVYMRNRIRQQLLPLWQNLDPTRNLLETLEHSRLLMTEDAIALKQFTEQAYTQCETEFSLSHSFSKQKSLDFDFFENKTAKALKREELQKMPNAIIRRVLHLFSQTEEVSIESAVMQSLLRKIANGEEFSCSLGKNKTLVGDKKLIFWRSH